MQLENKIISCTLLIIKKEQLERPYFSAPFVHSGKIYHSPRIRFLKKNLSFGKELCAQKCLKLDAAILKKIGRKRKNHNVSSQIDPALVILKNHSLY